jgi:hypothetical protein
MKSDWKGCLLSLKPGGALEPPYSRLLLAPCDEPSLVSMIDGKSTVKTASRLLMVPKDGPSSPGGGPIATRYTSKHFEADKYDLTSLFWGGFTIPSLKYLFAAIDASEFNQMALQCRQIVYWIYTGW